MPPALLTATDCTSHIHLIIGSNPLANARCNKSLEVGAKPILLAPEPGILPSTLLTRLQDPSPSIQWLKRDIQPSDLTSLGREEVDHIVDAVFITSGARSAQAAEISALCRRLRIPVNVADSAELSTFTILSTHVDGPLQIGVTTSGRGCKMAARIRREIAAALPRELGGAVERLGSMRRRIWEMDFAGEVGSGEGEAEAEDESAGQNAAFNRLVTSPRDSEAARARRMRWLGQICEYWSLRRLAAITDEDVEAILLAYKSETGPPSQSNGDTRKPSLNSTTLDIRQKNHARIVLAGSGPGHPDLLTTATLKALRAADLILADKLVPGPVLDLVPRRTPVHVARKFPGNADAAQDELHSLALAALREGKFVLRLKQGDPFLYGRGAEEVAFFRGHGFEAVVIPGVTSALSAPLFAGIPVTHRAVADSVLVCTGTGRKGAAPDPPPFLPSQTVVFLMALHRVRELVASLTQRQADAWPVETPCAVIERASCPDQRVVRTTLEWVGAAVEEIGSRPPGLLVVGRACEVLGGRGDKRWVVEEGFWGLDGLDGVGDALAGIMSDDGVSVGMPVDVSKHVPVDAPVGREEKSPTTYINAVSAVEVGA